jgi:hypothetical protein
MQIWTTSKRLAALGLALGGLTACGGNKLNRIDTPSDSQVRMQAPKKSVYVRASFDDDPSPYLGRFLPSGIKVDDIDENAAAQTRCSKFITYKTLKASGTYDEVINASSGVAASLGVAAVGNISASAGSKAGVRVTYKLDKKMRAEIKDVDGFDRCCKAAADQCSDLMIGEFLSGTGEVYQFAGSEQGIKAAGRQALNTGDFDFKSGIAWKRASTFDGVYFAFRTQAARLGGMKTAPDDCSWANAVPTSLDGTYFVGMSQPAMSEAQARDYAQRNGRAAVVRYLGEFIQTSTGSTSSAVQGFLKDEDKIQTVAKGLARKVKAEKFCPAKQQETPDGMMYVAQVLMFFPKAEEKAAAQATLNAVESDLKKSGKLSKTASKDLKAMREKLKK